MKQTIGQAGSTAERDVGIQMPGPGITASHLAADMAGVGGMSEAAEKSQAGCT